MYCKISYTTVKSTQEGNEVIELLKFINRNDNFIIVNQDNQIICFIDLNCDFKQFQKKIKSRICDNKYKYPCITSAFRYEELQNLKNIDGEILYYNDDTLKLQIEEGRSTIEYKNYEFLEQTNTKEATTIDELRERASGDKNQMRLFNIADAVIPKLAKPRFTYNKISTHIKNNNLSDHEIISEATGARKVFEHYKEKHHLFYNIEINKYINILRSHPKKYTIHNHIIMPNSMENRIVKLYQMDSFYKLKTLVLRYICYEFSGGKITENICLENCYKYTDEYQHKFQNINNKEDMIRCVNSIISDETCISYFLINCFDEEGFFIEDVFKNTNGIHENLKQYIENDFEDIFNILDRANVNFKRLRCLYEKKELIEEEFINYYDSVDNHALNDKDFILEFRRNITSCLNDINDEYICKTNNSYYEEKQKEYFRALTTKIDEIIQEEDEKKPTQRMLDPYNYLNEQMCRYVDKYRRIYTKVQYDYTMRNVIKINISDVEKNLQIHIEVTCCTVKIVKILNLDGNVDVFDVCFIENVFRKSYKDIEVIFKNYDKKEFLENYFVELFIKYKNMTIIRNKHKIIKSLDPAEDPEEVTYLDGDVDVYLEEESDVESDEIASETEETMCEQQCITTEDEVFQQLADLKTTDVKKYYETLELFRKILKNN
jgi:hypothetical protein